MAKSKGKHVSDKEQYNAYSTQLRRIKNRKARLARHLKNHPNDNQAVVAAKVEGNQKQSSGVKGHFPARKDILRDGAGNLIEMSNYEPVRKEKK